MDTPVQHDDRSDDRSDGRDETHAERMDRLFTDLLQELRVMQTGAQLTSGFLLTQPAASSARATMMSFFKCTSVQLRPGGPSAPALPYCGEGTSGQAKCG